MPNNPMSPEPINQNAAGNGTGAVVYVPESIFGLMLPPVRLQLKVACGSVKSSVKFRNVLFLWYEPLTVPAKRLFAESKDTLPRFSDSQVMQVPSTSIKVKLERPKKPAEVGWPTMKPIVPPKA